MYEQEVIQAALKWRKQVKKESKLLLTQTEWNLYHELTIYKQLSKVQQQELTKEQQ